MADRPILFSGPMVRALLAGTKTQTRRVLNPQPYVNGFKYDASLGDILCHNDYLPPAALLMDRGKGKNCYTVSDVEDGAEGFAGRYVGDRLYVREAWRCNGWATDVSTIMYRASEGDGYTAMTEQYPVAGKHPVRVTGTWRPGIHMPRWASRLTLTVTDVRVQRLQEIRDDDAEAEGIPPCPQCNDVGWINSGPDGGWQCDAPHCGDGYREQYERLWNSLNAERDGGAYAWAKNPWVTATTFTVERGNIDAMAAA